MIEKGKETISSKDGIFMNSRERIISALTGKVPDRVPISTYNLNGWNLNDWYNSNESYKELMAIIREKTDCIYMWNPIEEVEFFLCCNLDEDMKKIDVWEEGDDLFKKYTVYTPKGNLTMLTKKNKKLNTVWYLERLAKSKEDFEKLLSIPYKAYKPDMSEGIDLESKLGEKGIVMYSCLDAFGLVASLMEFSEFMMFAYEEKDYVLGLTEFFHNRNMDSIKYSLDKNVATLYRICGPEYATEPYFSPQFFKEVIVKYNKELNGLIHSYGKFARFHCHGNINKILDYITETGADAIDPVEAPPDGDILLKDAKKRIGDRMCIMGNIELKHLETLDESEIDELVKKAVEDAACGGRFILMPTAAPLDAVLSERTKKNYIRFIEAGLKYGKY